MIKNVSAFIGATALVFISTQAARIADASVHTANSILKTNKTICESAERMEATLYKELDELKKKRSTRWF
jgi:dihydroxyacetone kinase-like predicted kinase